jgi:hypothetical protein
MRLEKLMIPSNSCSFRRGVMMGSVLICVIATAVKAQDTSATVSAKRPHRWYDPRRYVDRCIQAAGDLQHLEIVEMVSSIAQGRPSDGSGGWFHDGQSRYGWEWLADRYDFDGDDMILRDDLPPQAADMAARLDRDQDGKITKDDFDWSSNSTYMKQTAQTKRLFGSVDRDRNGHLTKEEWNSFFAQAALDADSITPADLQAALFPPQPPSAQPTPLDFLRGWASGELGSIFEGPKVGQLAPDFDLSDHQRERRFRLSQYRDKRPLVLIFGSFT